MPRTRPGGELCPGRRRARSPRLRVEAIDLGLAPCVEQAMPRSATDIIQDAINAAVVDAIVALKDASKGLPNALLRDLNAIHANTAFGDLPEAVQTAVAASVRDTFAKLQKEGYAIAEAKSVHPAGPRPPGSRPPGGPGGSRSGPPPSRRRTPPSR
jgi:hypothetical protein